MPNTAPLKIKTLRFKYEKINSKNQHTLHKISYSNLTCTPNPTIPRSSQRFQELTKISLNIYQEKKKIEGISDGFPLLLETSS